MSIASRITSIEGHISDIYDSVELTGVDTTDIDKNLVNVPNTLKEGYIDIINNGTDTLYNNFPKVSGEGTSLTLNNTYQAPMRNFLKGNTSQTGTPTPTSPIDVNVVSGDNEIQVCGKNLCNNDIILSFFLNFTNSTIGEAEGSKTMYAKVPKNTDITISRATLTNRFRIGLLNEIPQNGGTFYLAYIGDSSSDLSKTINSGNYEYVAVQYTNQSENTNIQIEKSNQATNFEPYQGNTYNIDLPMGINLYDFMNNTYNNEGNLTITKLSNGYTLTNSISSLGRIIFSDANVNSSKNYVISFEINNPDGKLARLGWSGSSKTVETTATSGKITGVLTGITTSAFSIYIDGNSTITITNLMYYEGTDTSKTYEPYGTTPIELCKIGNYQDYIYKDSDKWYLHKEIGKVTYNGTENWTTFAINYEYQIILQDAKEGDFENQFFPSLCNKYVNHNVGGASLNNYEFSNFTSGVYRWIRIRHNDITTLANYKTWLASNTPTFYYLLATPTSTEITDTTLINQLEQFYQAQSKNNQTNISQINNDLGFIISASALKKGV